MQIRELNLKELDIVYELVSQLHTQLSYKEFEDLIYDMRDMEYKMIGLMDNEKLITYAGISIQTNLYHKRHLYIYELVTDEAYRLRKYANMMMEYLQDYAKMGMCENIVSSFGLKNTNANKFYKEQGFSKKNFEYLKEIK
jgi:ribosomal protein S18 acetylase RimI-like enzyme